MASKIYKKRHWGAILYPESLPADWKDILRRSGLPVAISPLHNKDYNPDGSKKKEHYHIIISYDGPTTLNNVKNITEALHAPNPQGLDSVRGAYRYFGHLDNPEKAQYSADEIVTINGFNILDFAELTRTEVTTIIRRLQQLTRDLDLVELADLADYLEMNDMMPEYDVLTSHTYFIEKYISSRRNKAKYSAV